MRSLEISHREEPGRAPLSIAPEVAASPAPPRADELRHAAAASLALRLSPRYLEQHCLLPLAVEGSTLLVAAGRPLDVGVLDELAWVYGRAVRVIEAPAAEIEAAVLATASASTGEEDATSIDPRIELDEEMEASADLRELASQAPIVRLVNVLISDALRTRASDIHLESSAEGMRVRYRIDGVLHEVAQPPKRHRAAIISRVKIMAQLDIAERRLPQDGRIRLALLGREVDLRVSTIPSLHGEDVVLRILDRGAGVRSLDEIGMPEEVLLRFRRLIEQPHGILLVTGPTGSGKTTTLYGGLREIDGPDIKIVTVEDPVEYQVAGLTQIPINPKIGLNFAAALRSILRHDPDVVMVGEMRDPETAEIALQAALTGHLVLSTLHTNDAVGGFTRLAELGIEPYLIAATVQGILAQRLVRVVCPECAEPYEPTAEQLLRIGNLPGDGETAPAHGFRRGRGCDGCAGTGYRGRIGLYELLTVTDRLREMVVAGASHDALRMQALGEGMRPLWHDGWQKARSGVTTIEEVLRVTRDERSVS